MTITTKADATCDRESENDVPRLPADEAPAAIGDSITVEAGGDRLKATLLEFIDPAQVANPGMDHLFDSLRQIDDDATPSNRADTRYVAVRLKMRNLSAVDLARISLVHTCSGRLIDRSGVEHAESWASVAGCSPASVPMRDEGSTIGCCVFRVPADAVIATFRLAIDEIASVGNQVEWILTGRQRDVTQAGGPHPTARLADGMESWNAWRRADPRLDINLEGCDLRGRDLAGYDFSRVNLRHARLSGADLANAVFAGADARSAVFAGCRLCGADFRGATLRSASFFEADAANADFSGAVMEEASLERLNARSARFRNVTLTAVNAVQANLFEADLSGCQAPGGKFLEAFLEGVTLIGANLRSAQMGSAYLRRANLNDADLSGASLNQATLLEASLVGTKMPSANLNHAVMTKADLTRADISGCSVYGVSAWDLRGQPVNQRGLVLSDDAAAVVTVDDLEMAQFIHLLMTREKLRKVIETMTARAVLILGRFTPERKAILDALADELRHHKLLPIIFDFERLRSRDFTETIKILVGLSLFVIVDVTQPKSAPQELQATIPDFQVAFVPVKATGESAYSMLDDFKKYDWLLQPVLEYDSKAQLLKAFKPAILDRAWKLHQELLARRSESLAVVSIETFLAADGR